MNEIVYTCDEFYVSYNPQISEFAKALDQFVSSHTGIEAKDLPETALCIYDEAMTFGVKFYILYGDHREAYRNLASHGLQACIDYFLDHIDQIGHSSETPYKTVN